MTIASKHFRSLYIDITLVTRPLELPLSQEHALRKDSKFDTVTSANNILDSYPSIDNLRLM